MAGRGRWKIENEGFNNQKNGVYRIEHLNSKNNTAMKNHYLLTQISDILMQLYLAWNPYIRELKQTIKNTSSGLLESFRRQPVTEEDVSYKDNLSQGAYRGKAKDEIKLFFDSLESHLQRMLFLYGAAFSYITNAYQTMYYNEEQLVDWVIKQMGGGE